MPSVNDPSHAQKRAEHFLGAPSASPERRRGYLRDIAHAVCIVSIRCRIIGPTSLALDLSSARSVNVLRFEVQRFIGAKLLGAEHVVLGRLTDLTDEDYTYIALALPLVAGQFWNEDILKRNPESKYDNSLVLP